jgi:hypothetical protein
VKMKTTKVRKMDMNNCQKHMQSLVAEREQRELNLKQLDREIREQERKNGLLWAMARARKSLTVGAVETPRVLTVQGGVNFGVWTGYGEFVDNGVSENYGVSAEWSAKSGATDGSEGTCSGVTKNGAADCTVAECGVTGAEVAGIRAVNAGIAEHGAMGAQMAGCGATGFGIADSRAMPLLDTG